MIFLSYRTSKSVWRYLTYSFIFLQFEMHPFTLFNIQFADISLDIHRVSTDQKLISNVEINNSLLCSVKNNRRNSIPSS